MSKIPANTIKPGTVLQHDGGLWVCVKAVNVKPGKGGAFAQVELKNLIDGRKLNERFRTSDTVDEVELERRDYQFLYEQGEALVFMNNETYDQIELRKAFVGEDQVRFLQDGMTVKVEFHEDRPIGIALPDSVVLEVVETEPTLKGQTAASSYKPAVASNGMRILIPPFMSAGERILVSTETGEYLRRVD
jgi:elongation factor P